MVSWYNFPVSHPCPYAVAAINFLKKSRSLLFQSWFDLQLMPQGITEQDKCEVDATTVRPGLPLLMYRDARPHACLLAHTHARARARTPARMHTCTHARTHAHLLERTHARTHARTFARARTHTHTHRSRIPVCDDSESADASVDMVRL